MCRIAVSDNLVIGPSPENPSTVRELADDGFQTILNLHSAVAPAGFSSRDDFSSRDEGLAAAEHNLTYLFAPLPDDGIDDFAVSSVLTKLELLPKPIFMHADDPSIAAVLAIVDRAISENWTTAEALQHASGLGLEIDTPRLRDIVRQAVESQQADS